MSATLSFAVSWFSHSGLLVITSNPIETILLANAFLQISSERIYVSMFTQGILWLSHSRPLLASSFTACTWEDITGFQALLLWRTCSLPFCFTFVTVQFRETAHDGKTLSHAVDICALTSFAELLFFFEVILGGFFSVPLPLLFILVLHQ